MSSAMITTSARLMNSTPQTEEQAMVRKVAVSSFLGNFIEWFDYAPIRTSPPLSPGVLPNRQSHRRHAADLRRVRAILHPASNRRTVLG